MDVSGVDVIAGVPGDYQATTDYFIEPRTGTIIDQVVHQERQADGIGPILELDLEFTDARCGRTSTTPGTTCRRSV